MNKDEQQAELDIWADELTSDSNVDENTPKPNFVKVMDIPVSGFCKYRPRAKSSEKDVLSYGCMPPSSSEMTQDVIIARKPKSKACTNINHIKMTLREKQDMWRQIKNLNSKQIMTKINTYGYT